MNAILTFSFLFFSCAHLLALPEYDYLHPRPHAEHVSQQSTIIIRLKKIAPHDVVNLSSFIHVQHEKTRLSGATFIASDDRTIIFKPDSPFVPGASICVSLAPRVSANLAPLHPVTFRFQVARTEFLSEDKSLNNFENTHYSTTLQKAGGTAHIMPNGVSVPSDFPHIKVTINKETADGYIFLNQWREQKPYNIIFANDGSPVWYARHDDGDRRWDFKVQPNGLITMLKRPGGLRFLSYDEDFNPIGEYSASGGYSTDEHEFLMLNDGHYFLLGGRTVIMDMSQVVEGAREQVKVLETTVQEFTADHQLIFNWSALEYLCDDLGRCKDFFRSCTAFSFPHMNAIDIDEDGHILLSTRNLWQVLKINRQTGEIIWRLGGPHNQFTFVNDPLNGFNWQHDIKSLGGGYYSLFDNGREHNPPQSRAVIYKLDTDAKTATLTWEHRNPKGSDISMYMGNFQKLPNGHSFINWGVNYRPKATEVTPNGEVVYEMNFVDRYVCYRAFRFPWYGIPTAPSLVVESGQHNTNLIFNKFGDPDVAYYNIYAGTNPHPTRLFDTSRTSLKIYPHSMNYRTYYFRVSAVSSTGIESEYSDDKIGFFDVMSSDENLVSNGNFSDSTRHWTLNLDNTAKAEWQTAGEKAHILIQRAGSYPESITLCQNPIVLDHNSEYVLEFDAWGSGPRPIEVKIGDHNNPRAESIIMHKTLELDIKRQRYFYRFNMLPWTSTNAEIIFLVGTNGHSIYLDRIQLFKNTVTKTESSHSGQSEMISELVGNYPNPFNGRTTIYYHLEHPQDIKLEVYNLIGQKVKILSCGFQSTGTHKANWDGTNDNGVIVPSGIYICRLTGKQLCKIHKMVLVQ